MRTLPLRALSIFLSFFILASASARTFLSQDRVRLDESIKPIAASVAVEAASGADMDKTLEFMIALKMRNLDELRARTAAGEKISMAEMDAEYFPTAEDYDAVLKWVANQGLRITQNDPHRLAVFVTAPVARVQRALAIDFAKVTTKEGNFVSAINAPVVPSTVSEAVVGINGLQPHIRLRKHFQKMQPEVATSNPEAGLGGNVTPLIASQPPFLVSEIMNAYSANGLSVTGAGEKIAIVIDTFPSTTDLTTFWAVNLISQSLSNIEFVQAVSGSLPSPSGEESLDVEWTSGIASNAKVRVYASLDLSFVNVDKAFQALISDIPSQPEMHEVSISLGGGESQVGASQIQTDEQYFATMAAAGLTVFVSSGDSGSSEAGSTQVSYFASSQSVTAVGGTSLFLSACTGNTLAETAWSGSGGGISHAIARPVWQTGSGVPAGSTRLVPDVAAAADQTTGAILILNGTQIQVGGTSWSAPMWAGFSAMINQARSQVGLPTTLGLLGPRIYPLLGTTAFRDIVSGKNGAYSAAVGYDLTTGIGTPNISTLIQPLTDGATPPGSTPPMPSPAYAQIISPDKGCPLPSSSATFTWTPNQANAFIMTVGSTQGASDIFNSGQTGGLNETLTHLPTDGRTLWVRLWSRINGTWYNPPQDYPFVAQAAAVLSPIIAPASGTYKKSVTINMKSPTPGAVCYYTRDNGPLTKFTSTFAITAKGAHKITAIAKSPGVPDSAVVTSFYTIK